MNQFDAKRGTNRFDEDKNRKKKKKKMELKRLHVTRILNSFYTYPQKIQYKKKKKRGFYLERMANYCSETAEANASAKSR